MIESHFNRAGLAALSDIDSYEYKAVFAELEKSQVIFLKQECQFRSEEYKWPRDPLHCWSRVWEYPYVYYHLARHIEKLSKDIRPIVADVGSGVTFFPFSLAQLGYEVICTDIDPLCGNDLNLACKSVPHSPGMIKFRLIEDSKLPFEDEECNVVYCISVLEHIPDFEHTLKEIIRILKRGGLCLLTCDMGLDSTANSQLDAVQYERLMHVLEEHFCLVRSERTIHPINVLTNWNSPYPEGRNSYPQIGWQLIKQKVLKPLLGRKPGRVSVRPALLTVLGLALQKR